MKYQFLTYLFSANGIWINVFVIFIFSHVWFALELESELTESREGLIAVTTARNQVEILNLVTQKQKQSKSFLSLFNM